MAKMFRTTRRIGFAGGRTVWRGMRRIGGSVLAIFLIWQVWSHLGPEKPSVSPARIDAAEQVIPQVLEDLRARRGSIRDVALLHLANDPSDYLTNALRKAIEESGILDLRDRSVFYKLRDTLGFRHHGYGSRAEAIQRGRSLDVAGVLFGVVHAFESYPGGAKLDLELCLADVGREKEVFRKRYTRTPPESVLAATVIQETVHRLPAAQRFLAWVMIVLLLPVFTIGFVRAMVRKESNLSNTFTLAVYTLVDGIAAYLLIGGPLRSFFSVILFLAAVGLSFVYNVAVMAFGVRLES